MVPTYFAERCVLDALRMDGRFRMRGLISVLLVLGPTFFFGITTDAGKMGIAAAAGAAAAMLLNLNRLKYLKLGIMEAQLQEKIVQATATLEAFQDLAVETLAFNVDQITNAMRLAGQNEVSKRDVRVAQLCDVAVRMGVHEDPRLTTAVEKHHRMMAFDLFDKIGSSYNYESKTKKALHNLAANCTHLPNRDEIVAVFIGQEMRPETVRELDEYVTYSERKSMPLE